MGKSLWLRLTVRDMVCLLLVAVIFLTVLVLDKPSKANKKLVGVATAEAMREYERVMDAYGDREAAQRASDLVFEERMEAGWE